MSAAPRRTVFESAEGEAAGSAEDERDAPAGERLGSPVRTAPAQPPTSVQMVTRRPRSSHDGVRVRNRSRLTLLEEAERADDAVGLGQPGVKVLGREGPDQDEDGYSIDVRDGEAAGEGQQGVVADPETFMPPDTWMSVPPAPDNITVNARLPPRVASVISLICTPAMSCRSVRNS